MSEYVYTIEFNDQHPPDKLGRRSFTLRWTEPDGVYRPEPSKVDGKPVGYRRAQCFFAKPEHYGFDGRTGQRCPKEPR